MIDLFFVLFDHLRGEEDEKRNVSVATFILFLLFSLAYLYTLVISSSSAYVQQYLSFSRKKCAPAENRTRGLSPVNTA